MDQSFVFVYVFDMETGTAEQAQAAFENGTHGTATTGALPGAPVTTAIRNDSLSGLPHVCPQFAMNRPTDNNY